jgi:hypothetical protein
MSATEQLLERVKLLDEAQAKTVLGMLEKLSPEPPAQKPRAKTKSKGGVWSVMGCAKKYNHPYKTTAEWMAVLREGDKN